MPRTRALPSAPRKFSGNTAYSANETAPRTKHPRRFGQIPNLAVPDNVDDALTERNPVHGKAIHASGHTAAKRHCDATQCCPAGCASLTAIPW
jgi:hypothetical protein